MEKGRIAGSLSTKRKQKCNDKIEVAAVIIIVQETIHHRNYYQKAGSTLFRQPLSLRYSHCAKPRN